MPNPDTSADRRGIGLAHRPAADSTIEEGCPPVEYRKIFDAVISDPRYLANLDGDTAGKSPAPFEGLFREVAGKVESKFTAADIIALSTDPIP